MRGLHFEIAFAAHNRRVKIFHATPLRNNLYWYEDRGEDFYLKMAGRARAEI